ncbi:MAG: HAD family hydrolase [Campylobacterota bacterium]|nr:HAD family hydrolase [Campylobacterota bacterium]
MKKYILFDNDGVLVETEIWYYRANAKILKSMGIDMGPEQYKEIMINGLSSFVLAERAGFDEASVDKARAQRDEIYRHYLQTEEIAINGVKEVLFELKERYQMGIITTSRRVDFELIHEKRGIIDFMDFVLCVEDYPRAKPHPDPYLKGLEKFNAKKEEAIVVEDSQRGLRSAVAAGIECVIVKNDFTASHDFTTATHRIDTLQELKSILK